MEEFKSVITDISQLLLAILFTLNIVVIPLGAFLQEVHCTSYPTTRGAMLVPGIKLGCWLGQPLEKDDSDD